MNDTLLGSSINLFVTKKPNSVALSTIEAEYVVVASCCAQLIWIKKQFEDFSVLTNTISLLYDNTSAMNMAENPVKHKRSKHIDIRHHFLTKNVEKKNVVMIFFKTKDHLADIFTNTLSKKCFVKNRMRLGMQKIT